MTNSDKATDKDSAAREAVNGTMNTDACRQAAIDARAQGDFVLAREWDVLASLREDIPTGCPVLAVEGFCRDCGILPGQDDDFTGCPEVAATGSCEECGILPETAR